MNTPRPEKVAYGVDIGGTKILGVAIGSGGRVLAQRRVPTPHRTAATAARGQASRTPTQGVQARTARPGDAVADAISALVVQLHAEITDGEAHDDPRVAAAADVADDDAGAVRDAPLGASEPVPVGIGIAGLVDTAGVLRFSPNLATASGADIGELVSARLPETFCGSTIRAHNDASCTALAELVFGAARGMREGLVITLGTGIGSALVVDGKVHLGARGFAGEAGHMVVDPNGPPCPCGNRGCWERYASGAGLARLAREAALAGVLGGAVRLAGGDPEHVTGEHVTAAAADGDAEALRVMDELGWWVGLGLANLVALFDPEWIVLGGGLGHAGEMLLEPTRRALASLVEGGGARGVVPVLEAALGEQAGAIGAALTALGEPIGDC